MNTRQANDLAMLKRVYDFITATPPAPPLATPPAALAQLTTQLQDAITKAEDAATNQGSGTKKVTTAQRAALRRTLRARYLIPIRHVARVLAKTTTGLNDIVQIPSKSVSEANLLAAAKATVVDVTPYQAEFIAKGLAPDFVAQLNAAISAVEQAADANVTAQRQKITGTADLKAAITDGRDTVISVSHLIQAACDQDKVNGPATRTAWDRIQHVHNVSAAPLSILNPLAASNSTTTSTTTTSTPTTDPSPSASPQPPAPSAATTTSSTAGTTASASTPVTGAAQ